MGGLKDTMKGHRPDSNMRVDQPKGGSKSMISLRIDDNLMFQVRTLVAKMKAKGMKASQSTLMEEGYKMILEKYKDI